MKIDRDEARRIADLAHLEFDESSLDRMAAEMTKILGYIEKLAEVDVADSHLASGDPTPMREDVTRSSLDRDVVAQNAPSWSNGFFVVPKVIE
jgi:aspartyl-tRNA(Asn)/glutamyl-tRNA(Gln) amidotransferase subunit C